MLYICDPWDSSVREALYLSPTIQMRICRLVNGKLTECPKSHRKYIQR